MNTSAIKTRLECSAIKSEKIPQIIKHHHSSLNLKDQGHSPELQTGHPQLFLPLSQINIESFPVVFHMFGTIPCYHSHEPHSSLTQQQLPILPI